MPLEVCWGRCGVPGRVLAEPQAALGVPEGFLRGAGGSMGYLEGPWVYLGVPGKYVGGSWGGRGCI